MKLNLVRVKRIFYYILLFFVFASVVLISLPKISINQEFSIGGYSFSLFNNKLSADWKDFKYGMDFRSSTKLLISPEQDITEEQLDKSVVVLRDRLEKLGFQEFKVNILPDSKVEILVPTTEDLSNEQVFLSQQGVLVFRQLKEDVEFSEEEFAQIFSNPSFWEETELKDEDVRGAVSQNTGVQLLLTPEGLEKFAKIAEENVDRPLGIYLDDSSFPVAMPIVSSELVEQLNEGVPLNPVIQGNLTPEQADLLAFQIDSDNLPIKMNVENTEIVDPAFNIFDYSDILKYVGLGLLILFLLLIIVFRGFGLAAVFSLLFYIFTLSALTKIFSLLVTPRLLIAVLFFILIFFVRLLVTLIKIKKNIKGNTPKNLVIFKSSLWGKKFFRYLGVFLVIIGAVAYYLNFLYLKNTYFAVVLAMLAHFFMYNLIFRALIKARK